MTAPVKHRNCGIVAGVKARMTAELLDEALAIQLSYILTAREALREFDDAKALTIFKCVDAAHRTARACAFELRDLLPREGAR
jgi:hypothetical protein